MLNLILSDLLVLNLIQLGFGDVELACFGVICIELDSFGNVKSGAWSVDNGMWNVKCGAWSADCGAWHVECEKWRVECGPWSVERGL